MRGPILLCAAAMMGAAACTEGKAEQTGPDVSRSFPVSGFDKLEVSGPFDVQVSTGRQPSVTARGPSSIVEKMVVRVDGNTLKIEPEKRRGVLGGWNWRRGSGKVRVVVDVPMLTAAAIAGSGGVGVDRIATGSFRGSIAGSGDLRLPQVEVGSLQLEIAGSGNASAAGRAGEARYEIAGAGNILAGRVATQQTRAEIAGSGNIEADARTAARVEIAGSGNVRVTGGAKCSIERAGSGNVQCS